MNKTLGIKIINCLSLFILLFSSLFSNIFSYTASADTNVSSSFTVDSNTLYISTGNGNYKEVGNEQISYNSDVYTEVKWHFDNAQSIVSGDFVTIPLPSKYLSFNAFSMRPLTIQDSSGNSVSIGEFGVSNNQITIIFNDNAKNYTKLTNGIIKLTGKTGYNKGASDTIDGGLVFPDFTISSSSAPNSLQPRSQTGDLNKSGDMSNGQLRWEINVNNDVYAAVSTGQGIPNNKSNVVLVDTLTKGQRVSKIQIFNPFWGITSQNKMSRNTFTNSELTFNSVEPNPNESYEDFYTRIESMPGSYGIYEDSTGTQTVLTSFGDLPGSITDVTYTETYLTNLINSRGFSQSEIDNSLAGLKRLIAFTNGKMVIAPQVFIITTVDPDVPSQKISNKAQLKYSDGATTNSDAYINYQAIEGGVQGLLPQNIKIVKMDDLGNLLPDIKFKLQILGSNGNYSDYTPNDGASERTTDSKGEIQFTNLDYGTYKVVEVSQLPQYGTPSYSINGINGINEFTVTANDNKGFSVTVVNPLKPYVPAGTTSVTGTKTWDDADNQDGKRPNKITVNLLADGRQVDTKEVTAADGWTYTFDNLDKYDNGREINYTITEDSVDGYTSKISGFDIKNSYTPGKTGINVQKVWNDNNDQDGLRPYSIQVQLYADNVAIGDPLSLTEDSNWSYSWNNLNLKAAGKAIAYSVKEVNVPSGYLASTPTIDNGNVVLTNTHTPETTSVTGTKTWDDADNQDGKRPNKITVNLLADGRQVDTKEVTAADGWTYTFDNLDKYDNGQEINYTITEDSVKDYTTTINGYDLTNTYQPGKTSVTVTKAWNDSNNQDGLRPDSIQVQLYANGNAKGNIITLTKDMNWTYIWKDLDMKGSGKEIEYTVKEVSNPKGYTSEITFDKSGNIIITNTHKVNKESPVTSTTGGGGITVDHFQKQVLIQLIYLKLWVQLF